MQYKKAFAVVASLFSAAVFSLSSSEGTSADLSFQNSSVATQSGTLIIAVPCREGLVICSDKRIYEASTDIFSPHSSSDTEVKLHKINKAAAFAIAGIYRITQQEKQTIPYWQTLKLPPTPTPTPVLLTSLTSLLERPSSLSSITFTPDGRLQVTPSAPLLSGIVTEPITRIVPPTPTPTPTDFAGLIALSDKPSASPLLIQTPDGKVQLPSSSLSLSGILTEPTPKTTQPSSLTAENDNFRAGYTSLSSLLAPVTITKLFDISQSIQAFYEQRRRLPAQNFWDELAGLIDERAKSCGFPCSYSFFRSRGQESLFDIFVFYLDGKLLNGKKGKYISKTEWKDLTADELNTASADLTIGQNYLIQLIKLAHPTVKDLSEHPLIKKFVFEKPPAQSVSMFEAIHFGKLIIEESSKRAAQFSNTVHVSSISDLVVIDRNRGVDFYPSPEIPKPLSMKRIARKPKKR